MIDFPISSLKTLPADELRRLSQHFQYLADTCTAFARDADKRQHHREYTRDYRKAIEATVNAVRLEIENGTPEQHAIAKVAARTRLPESTISARWRLHKKRNLRSYDKFRNEKIMRLKRRGHTNAEIAQKIGLSRSQIGRIIRKIESV
ncbi:MULTISPECIES: helix-turn-helix domain-containing protein [unclassified Thalassospira]|uniref:helix-turn-helix domain-containing protein n=1 Tax=unclassified Thalassospira TaxID=2648997 RepID=UPI0025CEA534|nr:MULTISPECIES: helix-turn-helix domain-containing protein [unclassified Thalassospira]|tara:strand:- start:10398 stop:10841 length:444 start_codon:yes stop_codon:yes gene_type:complete